MGSFSRNNNKWSLENFQLNWFIDYSNFLVANSPYSPPWKNLYSLFNFGPLQRPNILGFCCSNNSPNFQFQAYNMMLCCQCSFASDKRDRWENFSLFRSLQMIKENNQWVLSINLQRTFRKTLTIVFHYTKRNLLWNYWNHKKEGFRFKLFS